MDRRLNVQDPAELDGKDVDLLAGYLDEECQVQRLLLEQLREKERRLVSQDVEAIAACLKETSPLVSRLEEMTHRRVRILRSLGRRVGLSEDQVQLPQLIARTAPEQREQLETSRLELKEILRQIGEQNRKNQVLVRNGIELNRRLVHALFGCEGLPSYDRKGRSDERTHVQSCLSQEY